MAKKKTEEKAPQRWVYALPDSTLTIDGKTYKLGDSVDEWSEDQKKKHRFKIAPVQGT